jgi:hypothetical protein
MVRIDYWAVVVAAVAALRQVLCVLEPFRVGNLSHTVDPTPHLGTLKRGRERPRFQMLFGRACRECRDGSDYSTELHGR